MSDTQIDSQLIEQTRREVLRLIAEIEQLANQDLPPAEFFAEFSRRLAAGLAAHALALWLRQPTGNLQLQFQISLQSVGLDNDEIRQAHENLLRHGMTLPKPILIPAYAGTGENGNGAGFYNPTGFLVILAPLLLEGSVVGLVEVFLDPNRRPSAQQGFLGFVNKLAGEATKYLKNRQYKQIRGEQDRWNRVEAFIRTVHGGLNPRQVAFLVANEGKRLIECERLSIALLRGKKGEMLAISGQETVEKRSNLVQTMTRLAERVILHGENLVYQGTIEDHWPRDVKQALQRYLEESGSKIIAIVPMADEREFGVHGKSTSAMIVEMIEDGTEPPDMGARIEVVARHGASALYNALEYHRIPLLFFWRALGTSTELFRGQVLPKIVFATLLITGLIASMILVPWPLRMEGRGELVPKSRQIVFAPFPGLVESVKIRQNDKVKEGTTLLQLQSPDLDREEIRLRGELAAALEQRRAYEVEQQRKPGDAEIGGKVQQLREQIAGLDQQIRLIQEQKKRLLIRAPIAGRIMDWKPEERLLRRPVNQGDPLLEVADVDGRWILEIEFPENTVTHLARARAKSPNGQLPVTFVLSASPDTIYHGTLFELASQAEPVEQQNVIRGKIALDPNENVPQLKGVEVRVKADCGPHPVGYVLFRELIDFIREYVFF